MKSIFTELTPKEFFKAGGILTVDTGEIIRYKHFIRWTESLESPWTWNKHVKEAKIDSYTYVYDDNINAFMLSGTVDTYGIPNVNFTLVGKDDRRWNDFRAQRLERGFDDSETWSLDSTIAKFILPRLIRFKEINAGYPGTVSEQEWNDILDRMILAFSLLASDAAFVTAKEDQEKIDEGLALFAKWYQHLWW